MAKVIVYTPDLLFGSSLLGALTAAGHSAVMCSTTEALIVESRGAHALIVDLTDEAEQRSAELAGLRADGHLDGVPTLGYHSHVDPDSKEAGLEAGIDRVVPRSRMHREPAALVAAMLSEA